MLGVVHHGKALNPLVQRMGQMYLLPDHFGTQGGYREIMSVLNNFSISHNLPALDLHVLTILLIIPKLYDPKKKT